MAKIIVAAPPIPGELIPLLQVGRGLAARGHQVTALTGTGFEGAVRDAGLGFAPLSGAADYDIREHAADPERTALPPGPAQLNFDWIHAFADPMPDEHRALQELLEHDPDQYLICNTLFLGALPVRFGVPGLRPRRWVAVSAVGLAISSQDSSFFGPVPAGPDGDVKAANLAANAAFADAMRPTQHHLNALLREMGATGESADFTDDLYTLPDATAVLTVDGFEFHRDDLPDTIHLVGILPAKRADGWEPPAWWAELDGSRPVVVVTQGTLANHDLSELIEPTLTGLAGLDVTVVAALGHGTGGVSIEVPGNARVEEFIPFDALLPKADLLISNGGAGGTQQALAAGVPVIVAGETEDKPANAARVAYHRLGLDLATARPSPEAVAAATETLLKDDEVRDNVRRLATVYASHDALAEIERLTLG